MGWEVQLVGLLHSARHPVTRFLEIAVCFEQSAIFSHAFGLTIYEQGRKAVHIFEPKVGISVEQLHSILEPYVGRNCMLEGWWSANDRYRPSDSAQEISQTGYRVALKIPTNEGTFGVSFTGSSLIYEIGNFSLFSPQLIGEVAHLNFMAVLQEIPILSGIGLDTIRGLNIDAESDPRRCFLVYHVEPCAFGSDLGIKFGELEASLGLMPEDVQQIVRRSKDIDYQALSTGIAVFHRDVIDGDLSNFYHNLKKYLESLS